MTIEIITAALIATSAMTLFSYIVSALSDKLYKEPVLIAIVISKMPVRLQKHLRQILGWIIHYCIGLLFVILFYIPMWQHNNWYALSLPSGFTAGCIFGAIGTIGWRIVFLYAGNLPVQRAGYYIHLFLAHIIFGVSIAVVHLYVFDNNFIQP